MWWGLDGVEHGSIVECVLDLFRFCAVKNAPSVQLKYWRHSYFEYTGADSF